MFLSGRHPHIKGVTHFVPQLGETHQAGHDVLVETHQAGHDVLGAALNVSRLKCVEHIDQWSPFFYDFYLFSFFES